MKEIKRNIVTEQTIYELSKEELETMRKEARIKGRQDVVDYFKFSFKNYRYKLNTIGGIYNLVENILNFLNDTTNTIENIYGYSFLDFVKKYR